MSGRFEGFSFSHPFETNSDVPEGAVKLSQCSFDAMKCEGPKVQNVGQISQLELPDGFRACPGSLSNGIKQFESRNGSQRIGVADVDLSGRYDSREGRSVLSQPAHKLTDDEYFKVANMMTPGPWSGDGRNHEIGLETKEINGRKAVVYDSWRAQDPASDGFDAKPGPNDICTRVYFIPNEATQKLDVMWFQAKNSEFDKAAKDFDQSLRSVRWR